MPSMLDSIVAQALVPAVSALMPTPGEAPFQPDPCPRPSSHFASRGVSTLHKCLRHKALNLLEIPLPGLIDIDQDPGLIVRVCRVTSVSDPFRRDPFLSRMNGKRSV